MKSSLKTAAAVALSISAGQVLAFETEIQHTGMLYLNIPLNTQSVPKKDKSVMGLRFGQTRFSTDSVGSIFTYFRTRPALFDVQFGMVGQKNVPGDIHFGLMDLKLTSISSIEKTYINGQAVVGGIITSKVLVGAAAAGGIVAVAAATNSQMIILPASILPAKMMIKMTMSQKMNMKTSMMKNMRARLRTNTSRKQKAPKESHKKF